MTATTLLAAHPGAATHLALLGIVVVIGLIVYAAVRIRNKREAAEAEQHDQPAAASDEHGHEHHERPGTSHHHR